MTGVQTCALPICSGRSGLAKALYLADREDVVVVTSAQLLLGKEVDILTLQGRGVGARLVHAAIKVLQFPFIAGPVGPNRGHVVVDLEVGNVLSEVGLVFGEGVGRINGAEVGLAGPVGRLAVLGAGFLSVHQHGYAVEGADLGVAVSDGPNVVMGEDLVVTGQIIQQGDVVERIASIVVSLPGVEGPWILGRARTPVGRVSKEGVAPIKDNVLIQHVEVAGGAVADTVAFAAGDLTIAVQRFCHKDEIPFPGAGLVDGVLPELGGKTLGKVATQPVDAFMLKTREQIQKIREQLAHSLGEQQTDIFEAHLMVAADSTIAGAVRRQLELRKVCVKSVYQHVIRVYAQSMKKWIS